MLQIPNHLALPLIFIYLVVVVTMLYLGFELRRQARRGYGQERLISRFSRTISWRSELAKMAAWTIVAVLLVATLTAPTEITGLANLPAGTLQVVCVIDTSLSMGAEDYRDQMPPLNGVPPQQVLGPYGRRIDMVKKKIVEEIMPALEGNALGLVTFAGGAKDQVDLTSDEFAKIRWEFENGWMDINSAGGDGSDFVQGLDKALALFAATPQAERQKVIVLFSDGGYDSGPLKLATVVKRIKEQNIKLIVVAVGFEKKQKLPDYSSGQAITTKYIRLPGCDDKDSEGNCQTSLDLKTLSSLAQQFGGEPLRLSATEKLAITWPASADGRKAQTKTNPHYRFFVLPAIALVLALQLRGLRRPQLIHSHSRKD